MHRTQVLLEDRQYEALKTRARREDRSLSELIRFAVDKLLGRGEKSRQARHLSDICGIAADAKGPSARDHDKILYDWHV